MSIKCLLSLLEVGRLSEKLEHLVEVRQTRPVRMAFEILDYCKVRNIGEIKFSELIHFSIIANHNFRV